jgi:putative spermidine/putrescine transport system substrate-binding protein
MRDHHHRDRDDVDATCARLRDVLVRTRGLGRREFLAALGSAGLAATIAGLTSRARAAEPPVTTLTYGGAWKQAIIGAFGEPFTRKTGIAVQYQEPYSWAKLRAMHDAKAQQIDVVGITGTEVILAERLKMMTPIDWSLVDRGALDERQLHHANSVGGASQSMVVCYSKKKWPGDVHPDSWADFWNVEKFPGRRALRRYAGWTVEAAVKVDGVAEKDFYPLDVARAFRSLDRIKPHVKVWWSDNSHAQQLMEQEEVDLIMMANGRATQSILDHKAPFEIVWNEALCDGNNQGWIVPVGCPNPRGGMRFLDMIGRAETQATFARLLYYAPQNAKAFDLMPPDLARLMPTFPANERIAHMVDYTWWADHTAEVTRRFEQWVQS